MQVKHPLRSVILTETEMCGQILVVFPSFKYHENPFSRSQVVTHRQTDGRTDRYSEANMRIVATSICECLKDAIICFSKPRQTSANIHIL
jgi:hypothetical protein